MRIFYCLMFSTLVFGSCSLDEPNKDLIVQVETDFRLSIAHELENSGALIFDVETVEERPCIDASIELNITSTTGEISFYINDIKEEENCDEGNAPARGSVESNKLSNGRYSFKITVQGTVENTGMLTKTADKVVIEMDTHDGIEWLASEFKAVPENTVWGYFAFDDDIELGEVVQSTINELKSMSAETELVPAHYGYFRIADTGMIDWVRIAPEREHIALFILNPSDDQAVIDIFESLKHESGYPEDSLEAEMIFWDGRKY